MVVQVPPWGVDRFPTLLREHHREEFVGLLQADPVLNLFLLAWVDNQGLEDDAPQAFHFRALRDTRGTLGLVALVLAQRLVMLAGDNPALAQALGQWYGHLQHRFEHVLGPAALSEAFWAGYEEVWPGGPTARMVHTQEFFALTPQALAPHLAKALAREMWPEEVRMATLADSEAVIQASAQMHMEETGEDPLCEERETFRRQVRHRIAMGRTFVWFGPSGELVFKADLSAHGEQGAQLAGVYTAEPHRGQGIARRAMAQLCQQMFALGAPVITLYFKRENLAARRLYEGLGFVPHATYQTVFVTRLPREP